MIVAEIAKISVSVSTISEAVLKVDCVSQVWSCYERCSFNAYCLFSLMNVIIFCLPAHWMWTSNGFLNVLGAVDIAGKHHRPTQLLLHCQ